MSPAGKTPGSSADWLRHAASDLELARVTRPPKVLREALCFHAQQAAEKAFRQFWLLKVALSPSPTTSRHSSISCPMSCFYPKRSKMPRALPSYAVASRYPGDLEPITEEEYQQAVRLAEAVVGWVEHLIGVGSDP